MEKQRQKIIDLATQKNILKTSDVLEAGLHHETLRRLCEEGILEKAGRGLYRLINTDVSVHHELAVAAAKVPKGVVCLVSSLSFHGITTQIPQAVWMAFKREDWVPKLDFPQLRVIYYSPSIMAEGIDTHSIENVQVNITNPARTVADCFKYRNKIGIDVAIEALKEGLRERRFTMDELWQYAKLCRVSNVMRPYLESIT